jgi:hypothetical protein
MSSIIWWFLNDEDQEVSGDDPGIIPPGASDPIDYMPGPSPIAMYGTRPHGTLEIQGVGVGTTLISRYDTQITGALSLDMASHLVGALAQTRRIP